MLGLKSFFRDYRRPAGRGIAPRAHRTGHLASALGLVLSLLATLPAAAITDTFETAPERDPADALQVPLKGPGYELLPPARPEQGFRVYTLQEESGVVTLKGDGLALQRLKEISVLEGLRQAQTTESFMAGVKQAAGKPVDFVQNTVANPIGTAKDTAAGVGKVLSRISDGVEKAVTGEITSAGDLARTLTGQAEARRELAFKLGVDPYTTYAPLAEALDNAATVSTAGSLGISAVLALVPGGLAMRAVGATEDLREMVLEESREELMSRTRQALISQGIAAETTDRLLQNPHYTPTELAVIAYHLKDMGALKNKSVLVAQAADAEERGLAYAELRRIVLLLNYHRTVSPLSNMRLVSGLPVALSANGHALLALPYDTVAWTSEMASRLITIQAKLENDPFPPTLVQLMMPGDMTDLAAERLTSFGWDLTATLPMPDSVIH
ncbi:hypothetical protein [Roseibium sp.]|uniref:hypothetical protein n=1 Tax=Roseibium sp. TaxID=1936156 RepID=UPI003A980640